MGFMKKCYDCKKEIKDNQIMCEECRDKEQKPAPTLIIYDKI